MHKTFLVVFLFFCCGRLAYSQQANTQGVPNDNVLYRNEESIGAFIHTAGGVGLGYRRGRSVTGYSKKLLEAEVCNFKSPKEVKRSGSYFTTGTGGYVYGKLNNILLLRTGIGYQNVVYRKVERTNVEVRYFVYAGATLAFAKPVYLYVVDTSYFSSRIVERYNPEVHTPNSIIGRAPFSQGFSKTRLMPGGYLKVGLNFEYSERYDIIRAIEMGLVVDLYPQALEIMANTQNRNPLFSVYLKMIWGNKWY